YILRSGPGGYPQVAWGEEDRAAAASRLSGRASTDAIPAGVERLSRLVDVDHQGCVVGGGRLPLPGLAVDLGPDQTRDPRRRAQQMVGPHSVVLVEVSRPVVPPGIATRLRMVAAIGVRQSPCAE